MSSRIEGLSAKGSSLGDIRLERLRRLRELQAEKHRRDQTVAQKKALLYRCPGQLAAALDPKTVTTPALEMLDRHLVDISERRCERLLISLPPQEGKVSASAAVSLCGC